MSCKGDTFFLNYLPSLFFYQQNPTCTTWGQSKPISSVKLSFTSHLKDAGILHGWRAFITNHMLYSGFTEDCFTPTQLSGP